MAERSGSPLVEQGAVEQGSREDADDATGEVLLEVERIANDGRMLHAIVKIVSPGSFPVDRAVLRFAGFGAGALVRESLRPLRDALTGGEAHRGPSGEAVLRAYAAIPAANVSSYQVELLWGADARAVLVKNGRVLAGATTDSPLPSPDAAQALAGVRIEGVSLRREECPIESSTPCQDRAFIEATLVSEASQQIRAVEVEIFLHAPQAGGLDSKPKAGETGALMQSAPEGGGRIEGGRIEGGRVRMRPLSIAPGAQQSVRIRIPEEVMQRSVARFGEALAPVLLVRSLELANP